MYENPLPRNILSRGFVSLRPLCANFELLRYQRCSLQYKGWRPLSIFIICISSEKVNETCEERAVCFELHPQCSCPIFFFSIFFNCVMGHSLYYSSVPFPLILWDDLQVPQERYTKNGVAGQQVSAGSYVANRHQYYANCKFSSWNLGFVSL